MGSLKINPPVLLLGAHWDDEILLAGGLMFKYGKGWDIVCCTIKDHMIEDLEKFNTVCKQVGANPYTLPIYHRLERYNGQENVQEYRKRTKLQRVNITKLMLITAFEKIGLDYTQYNTIFTHNIDGDLGSHVHHKQIAKAAKEMFVNKQLYHFKIQRADVMLSLDEDQERYKTTSFRLYKPEYLGFPKGISGTVEHFENG